MERYSNYRKTAIPWLKSLPSHWDEKRAKYIYEKRNRVPEETDDVITCFRDGEVTLRKNRRTTGFTESLKEIGYQGIKKGDLVIHQMDAFAGAAGVSDSDGKGTPVYSVCTPLDNFNLTHYHAKVIRLMGLNGFIQSLYRGIRERSSDFRFETFARQLLPIPPLAEQEKIVSYLESKTSKIDAYVADKEKEIQLLQELKQKTIAEAVTKGLNPIVKMKDSGISWIGMIPEHWVQYRFATLFKEKSICNCVNEELLSVYLDRGVIRFSEDNSRRTNPTSKDLSKYQLVDIGNFVLNNQQAWRGSVGVSKYRGIISPAYFIFTISPKIDIEFANYLLRSTSCVAYYHLCSKGIGSIQRNLDWSVLRQKRIAIPPIDEQRSIVTYIEEKCQKIDTLITELQAEIDYLKEYKQRLIADVVTGQVNVQSEI